MFRKNSNESTFLILVLTLAASVKSLSYLVKMISKMSLQSYLNVPEPREKFTRNTLIENRSVELGHQKFTYFKE